jgi:hypothetical protein
MKNIPKLPIMGKKRFMNSTIQQQVQVQSNMATKVFQVAGSKPGCMSAYIATTC